jgi:hypothetical protein
MESENKILTVFRYYLLFVSLMMILQFLYYEVQLALNLNVNSWIATEHPENRFSFYSALGYMFFFSVYNIPVCGLSGIVFIIKRYKVKLAVLCLIAATSYYLLLRQMGDSF